MLQNYDFDILKIDMSFVRQIGKNKKTDSILHSIKLLAVGGDDTKLFIPNLFVELDCVLFSADK